MKYLSNRKTLFLTITAFIIEAGIYFIPIFLENMLLQKIFVISYIVLGTLLGILFILVNGASTAVIDGEYEKKFSKALREGKAKEDGENFHWNPLKLTLSKRMYYSKIILAFLFPIIFIFFMEYVALIIYTFVD